MDEISRGSAADDPGQRSVGTRSRKGGQSRDQDLRDVSNRLAVDWCAEADRGLQEVDEERLSEREARLMPREPGGGAEDSCGEPDESPVEDHPHAGLPPGGDVDEGDEILTGAAERDSVDNLGAPEAGALSRVLCALLLSSRESLSVLRLAQATNTTQKLVSAALVELRETLATSDLPLELSVAGEQVRLLTTPDVFGYLSKLRRVKKQERLSAAALETLAVIAYRQPVMRAEIEAIRGVKAGPILRTLLDHRMIKITGRADVPGRPLQYGTTQQFLETFGLESVKDLPSVKEFRSP